MGRKGDKRADMDKRRDDRKKDMQIKKKLRLKMGKGEKFKMAKQYVDYFNKFNKEISVVRIKLRDVGGDGNCLFRSFADQVDGNEQSHKFMRLQACKYMAENQQLFKPFLDEDEDGPFDKYIKMMAKDGEWGGNLQIQALCECFKCIVVIHKSGLEQIVMHPMVSEPTFGIIHIGYFQHQDFEHYVSIRQQQDDSQIAAVQKLRFLNQNMYKHLLYQDQQQYMIQKQLEELQIIQKFENNDKIGQKNEEIKQPEPYPGYPKMKDCKCGSQTAYKNCCFKEYQKIKQRKMRGN